MTEISQLPRLEQNARVAQKLLSGLWPFVRPYGVVAGLCLLAAAGSTLASPVALRALIIQGIAASLQGQAMAKNFGGLMAVAAALAVFSALRYYTITWLGERITGDLRHAVYAHVLRQAPVFLSPHR